MVAASVGGVSATGLHGSSRDDAARPIPEPNFAAFESRLRAVMDAGDRASQTFKGIVDVPPAYARRIVSGQFAEVAISGPAEKALFVPRDAVVLRSEGSYVYRIGDNNTAQRISVPLGTGQGDLIAVTGDLHAGDNVVVRGVERLSQGQRVVPVPG